MWKSVQRAFDVVGNNLAWLIGSGQSLRIGCDPWAGCMREHILPDALCTVLERGGYYYLAQVADPLHTTMWQQGWKDDRTLGLSEPETLTWDRYLRALGRANIRLNERTDELIWEGDPGGFYTPKAGYILLSTDPIQREVKWWWRKLWKQKCPTKGKLLTWSILENKVPTWDVLQRRQFQGPSWCTLCKAQGETIDHLFLRCPFTLSVWEEASNLNTTIGPWRGDSFEEALADWLSTRTPKNIKPFPIIVAWGVWIARNNSIFKDETQSSPRVAANCLSILDSLNLGAGQGWEIVRRTQVEQIDKGRPWAYFDGAASGDQLHCGGGGCIYLSEQHYYYLRASLGPGTNNFSEIMALKLLLLFAAEKGCTTLQVFGDSLLIIKWENQEHFCHIARLRPYLAEVLRIISTFDTISLSHIYRERNSLVDRLSKEAAQLEYGNWHITEHTENGSFEYHGPFQEGQI
jgi:ribonuclease HI